MENWTKLEKKMRVVKKNLSFEFYITYLFPLLKQIYISFVLIKKLSYELDRKQKRI